MPDFDIIEGLRYLLILLPSLTVHEWAHAQSALWLGDDTAKRMGRCSLNPGAHVDIVGTIILPLLRFPIGWAKPVPINPYNFSPRISPRMGMMLSAIAGPLSNVMLAGLAALVLMLGQRTQLWMRFGIGPFEFLVKIMYLNLVLAFFNLLPVPPLDGSRVADFLMPRQFRPTWSKIYNSGNIALIGLILLINFTNLPFFSLPYRLTIMILQSLGIAP